MYFFNKSIESIAGKKLLNLSRARETLEILIIDDKTFLRAEILRNRGFRIAVINDLQEIKFVEKYEIILCDIKGIGAKFNSPYEGAYLIKEIKSFYPYKYIIGYSAEQFNPKYSEYTKYCNIFANKDSSVEEWQAYLTTAINAVCDPIEKWHEIRRHLIENRVETKLIVKFENLYVRSMLENDPNIIGNLDDESYPKVIRDLAVNLAASAIWSLVAP